MRFKKYPFLFLLLLFFLAFMVGAQNSSEGVGNTEPGGVSCLFGDTTEQPCGICGTQFRECNCAQVGGAQGWECYGWESWSSCEDPCESNCGDGELSALEECDDGNTESGDGCSSTCLVEQPNTFCGDGIRQSSEQCDDGNEEEHDGCTSSCTFSRCDDSDDGHIFDEKGKTRGRDSSGVWREKEDRCINAQDLEEWSCDVNGNLIFEIKTCSYGCDGGECTPSLDSLRHSSNSSLDDPSVEFDVSDDASGETEPESSPENTPILQCRDEDGGSNPFKSARTMGKNEKGENIEGRDQCVDGQRLIEYFCEQGVLYRETMRCEGECKEGACITRSGFLTPTFEAIPLNTDFLSKEEREAIEKRKKIEQDRLERFKKRAERERQRQLEVEKEKKERITIGVSLDNVEKDFLVQEIRTHVMKDLTEIPPLIREADKKEIETIITQPELVFDTQLTKRDTDIALDRITTTKVRKTKTEKIFNRIMDQEITIDLVNEELTKIEEEITQELKKLEQEVEEFRERYERTLDHVEIKKSVNFHKVEDRLTGEEQDETIITLNIKPKNILSNFSVYQEIPKEVAQDVSELIFYDTNYEVMESDPLIVWNFANVNEDTTISYGVRKKLEAAAIDDIVTIPITGKVTEQEVERVGSLLKLYFPVGMILFIILVVIVMRRYSLKT